MDKKQKIAVKPWFYSDYPCFEGYLWTR